MEIERVTTADAEELLEIYAPYVRETAISFEYEVPTLSEFSARIARISAKYQSGGSRTGDWLCICGLLQRQKSV